VSAIVALLKSGRDQDYGGGFGMSGNKVRGYPRLRTALIDVLRQIATPEAKAGLLDALQGSQDPDDYRDIFLLYAATSDEQMVRGVSSMIPMALGLAAGDDPSHVALFANEWINRHGIGETAGILEQIARERLAAQAYDSGTFGTLVRFAPERAFDVARDIHRDGGEKGLMRAVNSLTIAQHEVPLAQLARYYEMMLSLDLSADFRWRLYSCMPATPCRSIKDAEARDVDTAAFLQFLRKRLPYETDPRAKEGLARKIELLEKKAGG